MVTAYSFSLSPSELQENQLSPYALTLEKDTPDTQVPQHAIVSLELVQQSRWVGAKVLVQDDGDFGIWDGEKGERTSGEDRDVGDVGMGDRLPESFRSSSASRACRRSWLAVARGWGEERACR